MEPQETPTPTPVDQRDIWSAKLGRDFYSLGV